MTKNQTKWRKSESCEAFTLQSACAKKKKGIPSFDKLDIPFVMIMKPHTGKVQGYKVLFHKILKWKDGTNCSRYHPQYRAIHS